MKKEKIDFIDKKHTLKNKNIDFGGGGGDSNPRRLLLAFRVKLSNRSTKSVVVTQGIQLTFGKTTQGILCDSYFL